MKQLKVEIGRVRTMEEVREVWAEVELAAQTYTEEQAALSALECTCPGEFGCYQSEDSSCERARLLAEFDEKNPDDPSVVRDALFEIIPDLEEQEKMIISTVPASKAHLIPGLAAEIFKTVANHHIRNARAWIDLFGSDSATRIDVFSWIAGVEPNYESLDDPTPEEEARYQQQMADALRPIKEELDRLKRPN